MNPKIDILICSVPFSDIDTVPVAPAVLKGIVEDAGFTTKTVDYGIEFYYFCNENIELFSTAQHKLTISDVGYDRDDYDREVNKKILEYVDFVANDIMKYNVRFLGLSVFSFYTHWFVLKLLHVLKEKNYKTPIVLGGRGLKVPYMFNKSKNPFGFATVDRFLNFSDIVIKYQLADHVIIGDGEEALVELLNKENVDSNVNYESAKLNYPPSNFDDYDFDKYRWTGKHHLVVTGSKGCVRNCDFCDIQHHFGKYRFRSGHDITCELIELYKKYGINHFRFSDSLINGSMKAFKDFVTELAKYNRENPDRKITWTSQYICRPESQIPKEIYKLMAESGAEGITIGAESGSNNVLKAMNKKTTVEALFYELEQFSTNRITCVLLTFPGHWSETFDDFVDHCKTLIRLVPYMRDGTISGIKLGDIFWLVEGVPAYEQVLHDSIVTKRLVGETGAHDFDGGGDANPFLFFVKNNPGNTWKERIYRRLILEYISTMLKFPAADSFVEILGLLEMLDSVNIDNVNQFYSAEIQKLGLSKPLYLSDSAQAKAQSQETLETFYNELLTENTLYINLQFRASIVNDAPIFTVRFNNEVIFQKAVSEGQQEVNLNIDITGLQHGTISFSMHGKNMSADTVIDQNNNILKDTYISLETIRINRYDFAYPDIVFGHSQYYLETGEKIVPTPGFWANASMSFELDFPLATWYNSRCSNNSSLSSGFVDQDRTISGIAQTKDEIIGRLLSKASQLIY